MCQLKKENNKRDAENPCWEPMLIHSFLKAGSGEEETTTDGKWRREGSRCPLSALIHRSFQKTETSKEENPRETSGKGRERQRAGSGAHYISLLAADTNSSSTLVHLLGSYPPLSPSFNQKWPLEGLIQSYLHRSISNKFYNSSVFPTIGWFWGFLFSTGMPVLPETKRLTWVCEFGARCEHSCPFWYSWIHGFGKFFS